MAYTSASNFPMAIPVKLVPGQKPPIINPSPMIRPPTIAGVIKVGRIKICDRSIQPIKLK